MISHVLFDGCKRLNDSDITFTKRMASTARELPRVVTITITIPVALAAGAGAGAVSRSLLLAMKGTTSS